MQAKESGITEESAAEITTDRCPLADFEDVKIALLLYICYCDVTAEWGLLSLSVWFNCCKWSSIYCFANSKINGHSVTLSWQWLWSTGLCKPIQAVKITQPKLAKHQSGTRKAQLGVRSPFSSSNKPCQALLAVLWNLTQITFHFSAKVLCVCLKLQ